MIWPRTDQYSFTSSDTAWVDHEWLYQVAAYAGHESIGPAGLVLIKIILILGLCLMMRAHLRREGHGPSGVAVLLAPMLVGASFRFDVRPELATLILLPLLVHLILMARRRNSARPLLAIPPLVVLWANLHAGVILAPVVLAIGVVTTLLADSCHESSAPSG